MAWISRLERCLLIDGERGAASTSPASGFWLVSAEHPGIIGDW